MAVPHLDDLGSDLHKLRWQVAVIAASPAFYVIGAIVLVTPPIDWLPTGNDARMLLGVLLGAQAAITGVTFAVGLFVLEGVGSREQVDGRIHDEYVRRSWVRPLFWGSAAAVGFTGAMLLIEPKVPKAAFLGACAFAENILMALLLFERARRLARPAELRNLRQAVYEREESKAIQAFLRRDQRTKADADFVDAFTAEFVPDPGEGQADEAIQGMLRYASRAMGEWRQADFEWALDTVRVLVEHAMKELQEGEFLWAAPGSRVRWPPLAEWPRNLEEFRQEVITSGRPWYANQLATLDLRLVGMGFDRRCGELVTAALRGYESNYSISIRFRNPRIRVLFRDRPWTYLRDAPSDLSAEENVPYLTEIIRYQERLLSVALDNGLSADFDALTAGFSRMFSNIRQLWAYGIRPRPGPEAEEELRRIYRIAIMGLAGRAILLSESGQLADPVPYLDAARSAYPDLEQLLDDIPHALRHAEDESPTLWWEWSREEPSTRIMRPGRVDHYPLTFISVRLLELATDPMPDLDLQGRGQQVLNHFTMIPYSQLQHARGEAETVGQGMYDLARGALQEAVRRDERA